MLDSLTSHNVRDFNSRYSGTWGFYIKDNKEKVLVYVSKVTDERVTFKDTQGGVFFGLVDKGMMFEFIPVTRGFFNAGDTKGTFLLQRIPARQWQRGISGSNTKAHMLLATSELKSVPIDAVIPLVFEGEQKQKTPTQEQVDHLLEKHGAAALSRHFAISGEDFWFFQTRVGKIINKKKIVLDVPTIYQEVSDLVRRNRLHYEVTRA